MAASIPADAVRGPRVVHGLGALVGAREFPVTAATLVILAGVIVLVGWWLGVDVLKSMVPGLLTMKVNTAIAFIVLGLGLLMRARGDDWADVPPVVTVALAAVVGSQYLLGTDFGIDQWLFREAPGQVGTVQLNRMAPMTVACFLLLGTGLILQARERTKRIAMGLLLGALSIAFFNVLAAIFDRGSPPLLPGSTQMAAVTAVIFIVASVGALSLMSLEGAFAGFTGDVESAKFARRLLGASILVPTLMTMLWLRGEDLGLYDIHGGASIAVIGTIGFLAVVIHQSARATQRSETARARILEERDRFFDVSVDMLATADAKGYFVRLNPAWTSVLGYTLEELTAQPFVDFVHPDDRDATNIEAARQIERGQTVLNFQNRYRHRDGSYRWLEWASTPSADGAMLYAMARDITDRKIEEERLAALAAPARELQARRIEARTRIQRVIAARAFTPVFQPIVELASRRIVGFEALTRFADGYPPDQMFADALDCDLGIPLETVTLEAALAAAAQLPGRAWLSLNVSPPMIALDGKLERILAARNRAVVLEITEHEAVTEYAPLREAVLRLGPGVRLAVDDAGAGVANFNHLAELRPDFVKVDAGLVRGVESDVGRQAVVAGLVHFAASAGCQVIAEGIETAAEQATVTDLGVTLGQGYLLARPAPQPTWSTGNDERLAPFKAVRAAVSREHPVTGTN